MGLNWPRPPAPLCCCWPSSLWFNSRSAKARSVASTPPGKPRLGRTATGCRAVPRLICAGRASSERAPERQYRGPGARALPRLLLPRTFGRCRWQNPNRRASRQHWARCLLRLLGFLVAALTLGHRHLLCWNESGMLPATRGAVGSGAYRGGGPCQPELAPHQPRATVCQRTQRRSHATDSGGGPSGSGRRPSRVFSSSSCWRCICNSSVHCVCRKRSILSCSSMISSSALRLTS